MADGHSPMNNRSVIYWTVTVTAALLFAVPGTLLVLHVPHFAAEMGRLGYPTYFLNLLGVFKVLAAIAILVPGFARLKEWAYAGMIFDIIGAIVSHAAVNDGAVTMVIPVLIACLVITSWALRAPSRRLVPTDSVRGVSPHAPAMERAR